MIWFDHEVYFLYCGMLQINIGLLNCGQTFEIVRKIYRGDCIVSLTPFTVPLVAVP
jgi:hypothetical protein